MNKNVHQGLHGEGFIYALACAGGFTTSRMNLDLDGVDWQIAYPGPRGSTRSPKLEIQVKSPSSPLIKDDEIHHSISVGHFNHLAGSGFQIPRFLAVVVVPRRPEQYAVCSAQHMRLSTAAYWLSLAHREVLRPETENSARVTVKVPLRNLLTVDTLGRLLAGDVEGATR